MAISPQSGWPLTRSPVNSASDRCPWPLPPKLPLLGAVFSPVKSAGSLMVPLERSCRRCLPAPDPTGPPGPAGSAVPSLFEVFSRWGAVRPPPGHHCPAPFYYFVCLPLCRLGCAGGSHRSAHLRIDAMVSSPHSRAVNLRVFGAPLQALNLFIPSHIRVPRGDMPVALQNSAGAGGVLPPTSPGWVSSSSSYS